MELHKTMSALALASAALAASCGGGDQGSSLDLSEAAQRGRELYLGKSTPRCATCHILKDAGPGKTVGPNLDTLKVDEDRIVRALTQGVGALMPSQKGILTPEEMKDIAAYVTEAAGKL